MVSMRKTTTFAVATLGILVAASVASAELTAVGPVNRKTPFTAAGAPFITSPAEHDPDYPIGYPLWYQDASGLKLTITFPPQGTSADVIPGDVNSEILNTGGETFYWRAAAEVILGTSAVLIEYAVEGTFGGNEAIIDGQQIAFSRMRIEVVTGSPGDFLVEHPYGTDGLSVVPDPQSRVRGNVLTVDVGGINLTNPDGVFGDVLAPASVIGPNFLTWTTFNPNPVLNNPVLQAPNPDSPNQPFQFVGLAGVLSPVKGGTFRNDVTVWGPPPLAPVTQTRWDVQGKVFPGVPTGNKTVVPANSLLLN